MTLTPSRGDTGHPTDGRETKHREAKYPHTAHRQQSQALYQYHELLLFPRGREVGGGAMDPSAGSNVSRSNIDIILK